jgi:molybdopterin-guanine dinucleotide biosynthesis adapter protein
MKVLGLSGYSNAGKTTLATALIPALKARGARVSAIKHAHAEFDIDQPGKDSHRLREAGAFEVIVANGRRCAKVREFEVPVDLTLHTLMLEVAEPEDRDLWVVVEGFRHMDQLKLEFWDPTTGRNPLYPEDPFVVAIITEQPAALPEPTLLPTFGPGDVEPLVDFLMANAHRFDYISPFDRGPDVEPPRWNG